MISIILKTTFGTPVTGLSNIIGPLGPHLWIHPYLLFVARRLERNIKDVLEEIGDDKTQLQKLLTGKRVLLAEELSKLASCVV